MTGATAKRVYLDYAATSPLCPEAAAAMRPYFSDVFANADSVHSYGREAARALADARARIAACLGAQPAEVYFTSGGTESDNWALKGVSFVRGKGRVIVSSIEHPAVFESAVQLATMGYDIVVLPVDGEGFVSPADLAAVVTPKTVLVSVMTANNEIGTVQPVRELADIAHAAGALFHTDAVQAAGSTDISVAALGADMVSLSSHKFGGPKGAGVLYVKKGVNILPLHSGGEQERGLRGGTSDVPSAVGTAAALEWTLGHAEEEGARVASIRDAFLRRALALDGVHLNGTADFSRRLHGNASLHFDGVEGEALLYALDLEGVAASNGSACSAGSKIISRTLKSIGLTDKQARSTVRFTFGRGSTPEDADFAADALERVLRRMRK